MPPARPRRLATWRWGGAIAALLIAQSLILATLFWALADGSHQHAVERGFAADCRTLSALAPDARRAEVRAMLTRDIHRSRFLGLFASDGAPIAGNLARLPAGVPGAASVVATVEPTELPGKDRDTARLAVCAMPDGTLLVTGVDLDEAEDALRVIERSLLFGLAPGLLLAVGIGLVAGRRAARQVDAVRVLTERIMAGELDQRLAVAPHPDSFGLLCEHINAMLDRVQALVGDVRGVGDDIAHQLRTPLTRLRARIERGLRDAGDPGAFAAASDAALTEIDQLLGIIAALLRIRELEDQARRSRFAPVDLARLAEDACDLHRPTAEDRGIALICDIQPVAMVEGDASLLIEAISNLLDNAMKFGAPAGTVTLSLRQHEGEVIIAVADDGPGVPPAERSLVTQRFYRGRHECEGAGLGLSLVKAITDLHGFRLRFAEHGSAVSLAGPPAPRAM